jgi:hypothetical protein
LPGAHQVWVGESGYFGRILGGYESAHDEVAAELVTEGDGNAHARRLLVEAAWH